MCQNGATKAVLCQNRGFDILYFWVVLIRVLYDSEVG
jgi:hypothetical protein